MPELPEVETIGQALRLALQDRIITGVKLFSPAMRTSLLPLQTAGLEGRQIQSVRRRARYLVAALDDGRGLVMHFGMTGVVRVEKPDVPKRKHEHVFLYLDNGSVFRFECVRRFSLLEVRDLGPDGFPAEFADFGVEPLEKEFTGSFLFSRSRNVKKAVKPFLMDNSIVCGVGNIYSTESLFAAGVDPRKPAEKLTLNECKIIVRQIRRILKDSIRLGGTTISDFRHVDGSQGKYALHLKIYGNAGKKCPVCGSVIRSLKQDGRTTVYCPLCQK